jgi:acetyl-CoA synthetase
VLPLSSNYEALVSDFQWDIPENYNMGVDVCDKWANVDPEKTAIIDLTSSTRNDVSFGELKEMSDRLAQHLREQGVGVGDRVGVFRGQSQWTAASHIAIWKLGAISVPLFYLFGPDALSVRLRNSGACAVITDDVGRAKIDDVKEVLPDLKTVVYPEQIPTSSKAQNFTPVKTRAHDPALLIFTSGTTGEPKGALHAHRVLLGHLPGVEMSHDLFPKLNDVIWTPADWAWIGGLLDVLMPALHHGVPVVAARMDKFNAAGCLKIIKQANVRNIFFPPTALKMLMASDVKIENLRTVASGGEPLGEELASWGQRALGLRINEFYGQTECNMIVSSCSVLFPPIANHIGRCVPGHDISVIDAAGIVTNEEGDIAVRRGSPVMMLEYWNDQEATNTKFRGDWMLTGDRGVMNAGYVQFVGREDDVITSSGYRIGPSEIEDCLLSHRAITAAAVVGKPCEIRTELIKAYVTLSEGHVGNGDLIQDLQNHVKTKLAAHEYPREIEFVESLPLTISGKIIRKDLKARAIAETKATK